MERGRGPAPIVKRDLVQPPSELVDKVFPFMKDVRESMQAYPQEWLSSDETLDGYLEFLDIGAV